jgi:large subunit ribosomal protein L4
MATATHYNAQGEEIGQVELPDRIFGAPTNTHAIWEVVRAYLANQRQGTSKVKSRVEVSGTGRKPYRQKGTGRARRGTMRAPLHRGGGRAFGPKPRDYGMRVPKKVRALALRSALSARARDNQICVIDKIELDEPKTREVASMLARIGAGDARCLLVLGDSDVNTYKSSRNLPRVETIAVNELHTYAVMQSDKVLFETGGLEKIEEVLRI